MRYKQWQRVEIKTNKGIMAGVAPVIISASRATDIPAFYSDWFFNRLHAGYCKWINPFNRTPQYISFHKTRAFVFWSKNPAPMLNRLKELDQRGLHYYFTFTVNDYTAEQFEPNIPSLNDRIATFKKLSVIIGKERVIWRFDPLLLTDDLDVDRLLAKIRKVGDALSPYTTKLVVSFADIAQYAKVKANLRRMGVAWRDFDYNSIEEIAQRLSALAHDWGISVATCGEQVDLAKYGIRHNSCIDGELLARLFPQDRELREFLGVAPVLSQDLFAGSPDIIGINARLKDQGQRQACGCIASKDIGQYDTCAHGCVYCYANASATLVMRNRRRHHSDAESICE